jgi:hypothetical protein
MRVPSEELNYHLEILRRGRSLKWVSACYERAFHSGKYSSRISSCPLDGGFGVQIEQDEPCHKL